MEKLVVTTNLDSEEKVEKLLEKLAVVIGEVSGWEGIKSDGNGAPQKQGGKIGGQP